MKAEVDNGSWLLAKAERHFDGIEPVAPHIAMIKDDISEFAVRYQHFNLALNRLNAILASGGNPDQNYYANVVAFKELIAGELLPNLTEIKIAPAVMSDHRCPETFGAIRRQLISGELKFPAENKDHPGKVASGLLIKGFAIYVQNIHCHSEDPTLVARKFELGIEEILLNDFPGSPLTTDALDWMIEGREDFSRGARTKLNVKSVERVVEKALQSRFGQDEKNRVVAKFKVTTTNKGLSIDPDKVNPEVRHYLFNHSGTFSWEIYRNLKAMGVNAQIHTSASPISKEHPFVVVYKDTNAVVVDLTIGKLVDGHPHTFVGTRKDLFNLLKDPKTKKNQFATDNVEANPRKAFEQYWGYIPNPSPTESS